MQKKSVEKKEKVFEKNGRKIRILNKNKNKNNFKKIIIIKSCR